MSALRRRGAGGVPASPAVKTTASGVEESDEAPVTPRTPRGTEIKAAPRGKVSRDAISRFLDWWDAFPAGFALVVIFSFVSRFYWVRVTHPAGVGARHAGDLAVSVSGWACGEYLRDGSLVRALPLPSVFSVVMRAHWWHRAAVHYTRLSLGCTLGGF